MFVTAGIEDVEQNINKAHRKKSSKKSVRANDKTFFIQISHQGLQKKEEFR